MSMAEAPAADDAARPVANTRREAEIYMAIVWIGKENVWSLWCIDLALDFHSGLALAVLSIVAKTGSCFFGNTVIL